MRLRCECGAPVAASNVNVTAAIATCAACGAVFSIAQGAERDAAQATRAVIPAAFSVPEPTALGAGATSYRDSARSGSGGRWRYRWFRWYAVFLVVFLVFWDTISFGFVGAGLAGGGLGYFSLLLPHAWVGVAMTYWTLAHLFNRSTIELDRAGLVVRSGPIPWRSLSRSRDDVAGFDVQRSWGNKGQPQFQVRVIDRDRRATRVLGGLTDEEATYLAGELNDTLRRDAGGASLPAR